jgi:rod shape-determining protein MreD
VTLRAWGRLALVAVTAAVVQVALLDQIVVAGAHPDLFLLLAIAAAMAAGAQRGAVIAFVFGLVADLFVPTPYGLSCLTFVLVAFAVGLAAEVPTARAPVGLQLATGFLGGIGGTLLFAGLATLIGQPSVPHHQLIDIATVVTIGCVVMVIPAYKVMEWTVAAAPGGRHDPAAYAGGSAR